jgi:hypothetical protein
MTGRQRLPSQASVVDYMKELPTAILANIECSQLQAYFTSIRRNHLSRIVRLPCCNSEQLPFQQARCRVVANGQLQQPVAAPAEKSGQIDQTTRRLHKLQCKLLRDVHV